MTVLTVMMVMMVQKGWKGVGEKMDSEREVTIRK